MGAKRNLVIIGNGMSGARTVEEILARGGTELFNIAMFGDEPLGNYNRILLSAVLDGSHEAGEILLNPLPWYEHNAVRLRAGIRATRILRFARRVLGADGSEEPYDNLIIATGRPLLHSAASRIDTKRRWHETRHLRFSLA
jgi:nitrite reductase (NADH) large subunit